MLIKVKVFPESSEDAVEKVGIDTYHVSVRAGAQNNHANRVTIHLLTKHFGTGVKLVSGGTRQNKIFKVQES